MTEYKLAISMVPPLLWGQNLRNRLPRSRWNKLRKEVFAAQPNCSICGAVVDGADRHAHEEWQYEIGRGRKIGTAVLVRIRTICRLCHFVEHPGLANILIAQGHVPQDFRETIERHFCSINACSREAFHRHLVDADALFKKRIAVGQWKIDFGPYKTWLEESGGRIRLAATAVGESS